jgi:hypothetical protein
MGSKMISPVVAPSKQLVALVLWSEMEWASKWSRGLVYLLMSSQVLHSLEAAGAHLTIFKKEPAHVLFAVAWMLVLDIHISVVQA